ncbi:acyltransferase [Olivibacter sp. XZL3]|uniref:acyltransferase family protein n=1 Tax=Olivibacter sp. XZL3 TaxID=1735116 RepID=UPI001065B9CE|nr:acyltransferase [Olivibacter sp. XZL3]
MKENNNRLQFLDCLRFFAALSVIIQHIFERLSPQFGWFSSNYFQFGVFGVSLFFITSGFIIPVSIEKHQSIKKFAISRIYRLYPLFLTTLVLKTSLILNGTIRGVDPTLTVVLANITMMAKFIGQPLIEMSFWTLNLEMAFYILVAILFKMNILQHSVKIALVALSGALAIGVVAIYLLNLFAGGMLLSYYLATMFVGTVYYRNMKGLVSNNTLWFTISFAIIVLTINAYLTFGHRTPTPTLFGGDSFWPVFNAIFLAYALFTLAYIFRSASYPKIFAYFGTISYSLYLNQGIVIRLVLPAIASPILSATATIAITFIISAFTYKYIELPFINRSRKIIKRMAQEPALATTSDVIAQEAEAASMVVEPETVKNP